MSVVPATRGGGAASVRRATLGTPPCQAVPARQVGTVATSTLCPSD